MNKGGEASASPPFSWQRFHWKAYLRRALLSFLLGLEANFASMAGMGDAQIMAHNRGVSSKLKVICLGALAFSAVSAALIPSIGLNLFTDTLAIIFGLFVIDSALAQTEQARLKPAQQAVHLEANEIANRGVLLLRPLLQVAAKDDVQLTEMINILEADRLDELGLVLAAVDLRETAPTVFLHREGVLMGYALRGDAHLLRLSCSQFLERFAPHAPPSLYKTIHDLERCTALHNASQAVGDDIMRGIHPQSWSELVTILWALSGEVERLRVDADLGGKSNWLNVKSELTLAIEPPPQPPA